MITVEESIEKIITKLDLKNATSDSRIIEGIRKYRLIKNNFRFNNDIFKRTFLDFYRAYRRTNEQTRNRMFELMQDNMNSESDRLDLLETFVNDLTSFAPNGNRLISYATKMIHTIDNAFPIMDSKVNSFFKCTMRISNYSRIIERYNAMLNNQEIINKIVEFKNNYECWDITDIKVIDFVIWG